jgi:hypothetical protein
MADESSKPLAEKRTPGGHTTYGRWRFGFDLWSESVMVGRGPMSKPSHMIYTARSYTDGIEKKAWYEIAAAPSTYILTIAIIFALMLIWQTFSETNRPSWAVTYSVIVAMLLASGASWWHSAKQAKERREHKVESRAMHEQIIDLIDQLAATITDIADGDDSIDGSIDLSRVTRTKLRDRAIACAAKMRAFEMDRRLRQAELSMIQGIPNASEEERLTEWQLRSDRLLREALKQQNEFRSRIWPEALALDYEIAGRLGRSISNDDTHPIALRRGLIAGISPVTDAANYLETMAHDL